MQVGNDICPKCMSAHPALWDCTLPTMTDTEQASKVTQADREAMSGADENIDGLSGLAKEYLLTAFARHRQAGNAEGMERAAVIIRQRVEVASKLLHNSQDWDCEEYPGSDQTLVDWIFDATAIRAAKGTGDE